MDSKKLQELVAAWIITTEQASKITEYESSHVSLPEESKHQWGFQNTLFIIWSVLIGLGVMSFVGLNRDILDDWLKIIIFLVFTWWTYRIWYHLKYNKNIKKLWSSLLFVSWLSVWATIFLIAQIYNIDVWGDTLLWIWILLILPLIYILKQKEFYYLYMLLLSSFLGVFFVSHDFISEDWKNSVVLYQLFGALILLVWYIHDRTKTDPFLNKLYKVFGLKLFTLSYFVLLVTTQFRDAEPYTLNTLLIWLFAAIIVVFFILWFMQNKKELLFWWITTLVFMFGIFFNDIYFLNDIFFILFSLWVVYFGYSNNNSTVIRSWNIYLYGFVIYLYIRHGYGYLNNFIFFLLWWVFLIVLWVFYRKLNQWIKNIFTSLSLTLWKGSS